MKKVILITLLVLMLTLSVSAQEYWNLRTSLHGTIAVPSDTNGMASGFGAKFLIGPSDKLETMGFTVGFEIERWSRSYELYDGLMDSLQATIREISADGDTTYEITPGKKLAENTQSGLSFSALACMKFMQGYSFRPYVGAGGGFYFIQAKREEARQSSETGYWAAEKVDNYLETKTHGLAFAGVETNLFNGFNCFLEGKFTYITDWSKWDSPYILSGIFGVRYSF